MAWGELIKNFETIRGYVRDFYVYGFKSRGDFGVRGSARLYDDERRRIESWLGEHIGSRQTPEGKNVFLSIDSRSGGHNPLFRAWGARSFTDGDITLHFIIFDILWDEDTTLSFSEITERIDEYIAEFPEPMMWDASTVRKKLAEYVRDGLLLTERRGREVFYRRAPSCRAGGDGFSDAADFFSEVAPCGVIGSFLEKNGGEHENIFTFKHHYYTSALDSEILCSIFDAMGERRYVKITSRPPRSGKNYVDTVTPLRIFISVSNGRQYLMAYEHTKRRVFPYRLDNIVSVEKGEVDERFDERREILQRMMCHMWGVSTAGGCEKVSFTVSFEPDEEYIFRRLLRERRCGTVTRVDESHARFEAEVYDARELFPFIRTFICRITELSISDKSKETQFLRDIGEMCRIYGVEEAEK